MSTFHTNLNLGCMWLKIYIQIFFLSSSHEIMSDDIWSVITIIITKIIIIIIITSTTSNNHKLGDFVQPKMESQVVAN